MNTIGPHAVRGRGITLVGKVAPQGGRKREGLLHGFEDLKVFLKIFASNPASHDLKTIYKKAKKNTWSLLLAVWFQKRRWCGYAPRLCQETKASRDNAREASWVGKGL